MRDEGYMDAAGIDTPDAGDDAPRHVQQPAYWDATAAEGTPPRPAMDAVDDTLREQVVETLRKYSDRTDGYQLGADKVMELIRAAVQAERERVRLLTDPAACPIPDSDQRGRAGWRFAMEHLSGLLDETGAIS